MEQSIPFIILAVLVFIAGFIDSIAGGGGLITIPAYLNYGLKEYLLLGTNKLSSTLGTSMAVIKFLKELKLNKKLLLLTAISAISGSFLGALFISTIAKNLLRYILIIAIPSISIWLILNKNAGISDFSFSLSHKTLKIKAFLISFIISFYDGMLGPGTGTFLAISYSRFCGYDIIQATALSKWTNLLSNLSALMTFLYLDRVNIKLGFAMGIISVIGNFAGSHLALKKGAIIIKPFLFIIANLLLLKIIYDMLK